MEEEDQNFQLNGIIVEPKFENTEHEKMRIRQKVMNYHPMLNPPYWVPNNITEFLFYDDQGVMQTNEETCKALYREFTNIMKTVYEDSQKKYEDTIKIIIQDTDLDSIDFPLIAKNIEIDTLHTLLGAELCSKLNVEPEAADEEERKEQERGGF